jgi:hypothetical protein
MEGLAKGRRLHSDADLGHDAPSTALTQWSPRPVACSAAGKSIREVADLKVRAEVVFTSTPPRPPTSAPSAVPRSPEYGMSRLATYMLPSTSERTYHMANLLISLVGVTLNPLFKSQRPDLGYGGRV